MSLTPSEKAQEQLIDWHNQIRRLTELGGHIASGTASAIERTEFHDILKWFEDWAQKTIKPL
jgi:hypothetical protein